MEIDCLLPATDTRPVINTNQQKQNIQPRISTYISCQFTDHLKYSTEIEKYSSIVESWTHRWKLHGRKRETVQLEQDQSTAQTPIVWTDN